MFLFNTVGFVSWRGCGGLIRWEGVYHWSTELTVSLRNKAVVHLKVSV